MTHQFNIWSAKSAQIQNGEKNVELNILDFNENDRRLTGSLFAMYPYDSIKSNVFIHIGEKNYVLSEHDATILTAEQEDILASLSTKPELRNPVYIEIGNGGELIID